MICSEVLEHLHDDRVGDARARPGAASRRDDGGDGAALRPRARQLGAVGRVPRRRGRPHPDLPAPPAARAAARERARGHRAPATPTGCTAPTGGCGAASGRPTRTTGSCAPTTGCSVWDIVEAPRSTRLADAVLSPVIGKSIVVYLRSPGRATVAPVPRARRRRRVSDAPRLARCRGCPGVLSSGEVAASGGHLAALQRPDGMVPWFDGGHCDPWNHVEAAMALSVCGRVDEAEAAYGWLAATQLRDGVVVQLLPRRPREGRANRHQRVRLRRDGHLAPLLRDR